MYIQQDSIELRLKKLFESTNIDERFLVTQKALTPLQPCNPELVKQYITNPITGAVYDGIPLFGEFASINVLNNNQRYYNEENYIEFVELLKKEIFSPKGLYGEFEHPEGYAVHGPSVTHKILDIWYDKNTKKVYGYVMLLNNSKAETAREIIKSGGLLGISARGGGKEIDNGNKTFNAILSLLVTFDLVYHPGFSTSLIGFDPEFLFENNGRFTKKQILFESQKTEEERDEEKMEDGVNKKEKKQKEKQLQNAVDNLNESKNFIKNYNKILKL